MKADIKADGTLEISAETEVEAFALKHWSTMFLEQNGPTKPGGVTVLFRMEVPPVPHFMPGSFS